MKKTDILLTGLMVLSVGVAGCSDDSSANSSESESVSNSTSGVDPENQAEIAVESSSEIHESLEHYLISTYGSGGDDNHTSRIYYMQAQIENADDVVFRNYDDESRNEDMSDHYQGVVSHPTERREYWIFEQGEAIDITSPMESVTLVDEDLIPRFDELPDGFTSSHYDADGTFDFDVDALLDKPNAEWGQVVIARTEPRDYRDVYYVEEGSIQHAHYDRAYHHWLTAVDEKTLIPEPDANYPNYREYMVDTDLEIAGKDFVRYTVHSRHIDFDDTSKYE